MEAWIEIYKQCSSHWPFIVASFMEAWIEIMPAVHFSGQERVASFVEAWIEMYRQILSLTARIGRLLSGSPPSWRRGLKYM